MRAFIILILLAAAGVGGYFYFAAQEDAGPREQQPQTAEVTRGPLRVVVAATGEVRPLRQIELKSKASGEVVSFAKRAGDPVKQGELIVELDQATELRNLHRAEAERDTALAQLQLTQLEHVRSLANTQASLSSAEADEQTKRAEYTRQKNLSVGVSENDLATAKLNLVMAEQRLRQAQIELQHVRGRQAPDSLLAQARLQQAQVTLDEAEDRLEDVQIRSPIRGILLQKLVEEGQIVASGISATSGGTPLGVVADTSVMVIEANIDETDIGQVRVGQRVELTVDAHPGATLVGVVDLIPPLGELESNIRVYRAKINVSGPQLGLLKTGMTANVEIIIEERPEVLHIPSQAIHRDRDGIFVWLPSAQGKTRQAIEVGLDTGVEAEVLAGLEVGQTILLVPEVPAGYGGRR